MVNSVFSLLPAYLLCTLRIPKAVIVQMDKYRKHCLWRGSDMEDRKPPHTTWWLACKPKIKYGLVIVDLAKQNEALLMKSLHKFFNGHDTPWVQLIWNNRYRDEGHWSQEGLVLVERYPENHTIFQRHHKSVCGRWPLSIILAWQMDRLASQSIIFKVILLR
jgi:hypothetical protein